MTDNNISSLQHAPPTTGRTGADVASTSVSEFVAEMITEQRRIDGLSQLLADMADVKRDPGDVDRTRAHDPLGV